MRPGHLHIALYQPEIPQNAGNIARLAAGSGCRLHLIKPFGFDARDKQLRRAGLDYWPFLDLEVHDSFDELMARHQGGIALFSKFATKPYTAMPSDTNLLVFGRETSGLPTELHDRYEDSLYKIPMFHPGVRSYNLANAVATVTFHQLYARGCWNNEGDTTAPRRDS